MYLNCFNRLFRVASLSKQGHSYDLNPFQKDIIKALFKKFKIPFSEEKIKSLCMLDNRGNEKSNCYITIEIDDNDIYKITNYNGYLMTKTTANLLKRAFLNKGIKACLYDLGTVGVRQ